MKHRSQITRRTLLKRAAVAGAGVIALPQIVPSGVFGDYAPSTKLNIALLACGERARDDAKAFMDRENIVAICDVDQRQVAEAQKLLGSSGLADKAKVYDDYRKLLDEEKSLDAVLIAPGQRWHVPMSKRAMAAGKHVFCEKPLAHSCAQRARSASWPSNARSWSPRWALRAVPPTPSAAAWKSSRRGCWARFAKSTSGWTAVVRPAGTTTPRPIRSRRS